MMRIIVINDQLLLYGNVTDIAEIAWLISDHLLYEDGLDLEVLSQATQNSFEGHHYFVMNVYHLKNLNVYRLIRIVIICILLLEKETVFLNHIVLILLKQVFVVSLINETCFFK